MYKALSPGAMGLKVSNLQEAIDVAKVAGFEGVEFSAAEVADLIDAHGAEHVNGMFSGAGIKPAGWGMPVEFRTDEARWQEGLKALPRQAKAAQAIGCGRTMTWIMPCSNDRPMEENRKFHVERFKPISEILGEYGCSFGLEFIGPKTLRESQKYPFIHTMEGMLEMCGEIGPNMGLLLDCWHWHTSGATVEDLHKLTPEKVVYVHVNDAPPGVPLDEHIDNKRALPGATGVIDIGGFLNALKQIGYDGPITPEPFGNPASWAKQSLDSIWKTAGLG
jgi:sugar phosphate isomerase/epimerase